MKLKKGIKLIFVNLICNHLKWIISNFLCVRNIFLADVERHCAIFRLLKFDILQIEGCNFIVHLTGNLICKLFILSIFFFNISLKPFFLILILNG